MRSLLATLRELTLPFGAGTGQRIVLDGVTGQIRIYDATNALVMQIDPDGIVTYDGGILRLQLDTATGAIFAFDNAGLVRARIDESGIILYENGVERIILDAVFFAGIQLLTGDVAELEGGGLSIGPVTGSTPNKTHQLFMGGNDIGQGGMQIRIVNRENAATAPLLKIDTSQYIGTAQPIFDCTGSLSAPAITRVVVDDLWYGSNNGDSSSPNMDMSYGRGVRASPTWKFEKTTDTVLSTTAGTYTSIITTGNIALKAGRLYRITAKPGAYLVSAGSGFAATDTWRVRVYRSINGAAAATMRTNKATRMNVAAAAVSPLPDLVGFFSPSADSNVSFIMEAAKTAGAATVTSTISVDGGEGYSELCVEDIGAASAALH